MKKAFKNSLFMFILGLIIAGSITTVVASKIYSSSITFEPSDDNWSLENNTVEDAINDLYDMAKTYTLDSMNFTIKKDFDYGNWATSRDVSVNLSKGDYIIILQFNDAYSSDTKTNNSHTANSINNNELAYTNGICNNIDGDYTTIGSTSTFGNTGVYVTMYNRTRVYKCSFDSNVTVSYNHTRSNSYSHVPEHIALRTYKLD